MAQFVVEIATQGSEQAQADLAKLLNAAQSTNTEIIGLSKSLSTSANSAAVFANQLGLSAGVTSQAVNRIRDLKDAGADNANIFKILKDELGITATQYKNLVLGLKDADRQVDAFTQSIRDQETAQEAANKAAMDAAQAAAGQLLALQQLHGKAEPLIGSTQSLASSYNVVSSSVSGAVKAQSGYVDASVKAEDATSKLGESVKDTANQVQQGAEVIATAAGVAFAGLTVAGAKAVEAYRDFDQQMLQTSVISGASSQDFALLKDTVRQLGLETSASPKDIAALTQELARAGFTAQEQSKSLEGIIRASEATGESLSGLGGVIGQIIRTFSLSSQESTRVADVLVAAANSTNTSVLQLGEAFSYVGTQAVQTNQPVEEVATALGLLADAGLQGSEGGTALAEALRRLSLASAGTNTEFNDLIRGQKKMTEAFSALNTDIRDANGQLLPLSEILKNVKGRFDQLGSQQDKEIIANALFGVQGGRGFLSLMDKVDTRLVEVSDSVRNSTGIAKASGEAMLTGLGGSTKLLSSSIDTLLIDLGEFLSVGLKPLIDGATKLVNTFIALPAPVKAFAFSMASLTTALAGATLILASYEALQIESKLNSVAVAAAKLRESVANLTLAGSLGTVAGAARVASASLLQMQVSTLGVGGAIKGAGALISGAISSLGSLLSLLKTAVVTLAPFILAVASVTLAFKTWESVVEPAKKVQGAIGNLNKELGPLGVHITQTSSVMDELISKFQKGIDTLKVFAYNMELFPGYVSAAKASANKLTIASGDLQTGLNAVTQEFLNLEQAQKLGSKAAQDLIPKLEAAKAALLALQQEGVKNNNVSAVQLGLWAEDQRRLTHAIDLINQASGATKSNTDALKDNKNTIKDVTEAYKALSTDMESAIADLEENISNKLVAVNNDVKLSAKERSAAVSNIESQGAEERLKIIENFIQKRKQITGLNAKQEEENQKQITKLEKEAGSIRLDIAKKFAAQREEEEKRVLEAIKAQREAALQSELQQIDRTTAAYRQQANDRVQFQNSILEGLDEEKTALSNQLSLLQESATTADLQGKAKVAAIDQEIKGLQNARGLIQAINSGELNRQQFILAQNELRKLGLDQSATDEQIQRRIQAAQEARRQAELTNLLQQQESQRQQLALQQEIERVDLRRKVAEAEIALINTQLEVNLANQNVLRAQAEASAANLELIEARRNGASQAELINLQSQLNAKKDAVGLAQQQVKLTEQQVGLSAEQLQDAKGAIGESEKLFAAQTKNLTLQQQQAVKAKEAADESERLNVALDGALSSASGTANALERGAKAAKETASAFDRMVEANIKDIQSGGKTAKVSPDGQPTQYFVRGKEVSAQEYEAAVNKPSSQSSISISAQMDTSSNDPLVIKQVIDGLERFKANNAAILSASHLPVSPMPDVDAAIEKLTKKLSDVLAATKQGITQDRDGKYILLPVVGARAESVLYPVVGARAGGGSVSGGLPYLVGERGPELFVPKVTGTIVPNVPGGFTDTSRIEALLTQLVNRPLPNVNPNFTFVNEPNPLQAQVNLLQSQLRAARGV